MPLKSEDFKRQSQKVKNKVAYLSRSPDITEKICASSLLMLMPKFLERYDETQNKNKYKMLKWNRKKKKKTAYMILLLAHTKTNYECHQQYTKFLLKM